MTLSLQLYESYNGAQLADWTGNVYRPIVDTTERGFGGFTAEIHLTMTEAMKFYGRKSVAHAVLSDGAHSVWEGRLEDIAITGHGLDVTGYGYWRAFSDTLYTALWSDTSTADWDILDEDIFANAKPKRFQQDNNNRLYGAASKGATHGPNHRLYVGYRIPHNSARDIVAFSFDYEFTAATNWYIYVNTADWSYTWADSPWGIGGNGGTQTGSQSLTFTACKALYISFWFAGTEAEYTGESDATYFKLTNLRVKTTTSANVQGDEIAGAILDHVYAINPEMINPSKTRLNNTGLDLKDVTYLDRRPADALRDLAAAGDSAGDPLTVAVWENQQLVLCKCSQAATREWAIDAQDPILQRALAKLANSTYALYSGGKLRTAFAKDDLSIQLTGIERQDFAQTNSADATIAAQYRDLLLIDGTNDQPRAELPIRYLYDTSGAEWPAYMARAGHYVTVRNIPITVAGLEGFARFRLAGTRYIGQERTLVLIPDDIPKLEVFIAMLAAQ